MNQGEKINKLISSIGYITNNSAYIKLNSNEDWPIDYVRLDNAIYSNKDKIGDNIINYSRNVQKAINLAQTYQTIDDLGEHIDPQIIKYHPAWIFLRETYGFTTHKEDETLCLKEPKPDTFIHHYQNNFLALGFNVPYSEKINKDALMTYDVFESLFSEELMKETAKDPKVNHKDFVAFQKAVSVKTKIDYYKEQINKGVNPKDLEVSYKSVDYKLGDDGFPLITTGTNKKKKSYDFRKDNSYRAFVIKLAQKNPHTEIYKEYQKILRKQRNI